MSVPARRETNEGGVSHAEILAAVHALTGKVEGLSRDSGTMTLALQGVQTSVGKLKEAVGEESVDHHGESVGTGLTGRMIRTERWVSASDKQKSQWVGMLKGAFWATAILIPVLMYVAQSGLDSVFRRQPAPAVTQP